MATPLRWDIFCRVVDNYGDAAVCWRLALQLAAQHGAAVRLWMSDLGALHALSPAIAPGRERQSHAGIEVRLWPKAGDSIAVAEIVIEAFGCGLPDHYLRAMAQSRPHPVWVVLEYLSAESWVSTHHGLPSPHPRWGIARYFFFPGFVAGTGGVLRESDLVARRRAFGAEEQGRVWRRLGFEPPRVEATVVSIFAYEGAPLEALLAAWQGGDELIIAGITQGQLAARAGAYLGAPIAIGQGLRRRNLEVRVLPFIPQTGYDEWLWSCDCNFVRGEDSFVRAQWAALPFVWHIYPQSDGVHWNKLAAFLALYGADLAPDAAHAVDDMWRAWNGEPGEAIDVAWRQFRTQRAVLTRHARTWAARLSHAPDLAGNLAKFCAERVHY